MWHIYNLVRAGDLITAKTFRKVTNISAGSNSSERVVIKLTVQVVVSDFDPVGERLVIALHSSFCTIAWNPEMTSKYTFLGGRGTMAATFSLQSAHLNVAVS